MWRLLKPFLSLGLLPLVQYLASRIRTSDDLRRAELLAMLADGVVAELMYRFPGREWVLLVEEAVRILMTSVPSTPTTNSEALRRAVVDAFQRKGVVLPVDNVERPEVTIQ